MLPINHLVNKMSRNFRQLKVIFCLTTDPKTKDSSFTVINDKGKQQMLLFWGWNLQMSDGFDWKMTEMINQLSK